MKLVHVLLGLLALSAAVDEGQPDRLSDTVPAAAGKQATAVQQTVRTAVHQEARSAHLNRPTVDVQDSVRRELADLYTGELETVNGERFDEFRRFLHDNSAYKSKELYRRELSATPIVFNYESKRLNMSRMAAKSIPMLTYLTETQRKLVGYNEFRFVNTLPDETQNGFNCAVAGAVKKDVRTLRARLNTFTEEAYTKELGANPEKYLAECKEGGLIEYESSPDLLDLEDLYGYLKDIESVHDEPDTKSVLTMSDSDEVFQGRSFVIEYKFNGDSLTPDMVLIDYQQAPYLFLNEPNPMRFINYVDTASYTTFNVHTIKSPAAPIGFPRARAV